MAVKVINIDRNLSVRNYDAFAVDERLLVTSHFETVQGEGPYAGCPALFIRLAGCNIGLKQDCPFCDTYFEFATGRQWDHKAWNQAVGTSRMDLVVITGGEPLLQWATLRKFIAETYERLPQLRFQIETNGMLLTEEILDDMVELGVAVVMSPKIGHKQSAHRPLPEWMSKYWKFIFLKYVVEDNALSPYYTVPQDAIDTMAAGHLYVSGITAYTGTPRGVASFFDECVDGRQTSRNAAHAARIVKLHNLRLTCQMHLLAAIE